MAWELQRRGLPSESLDEVLRKVYSEFDEVMLAEQAARKRLRSGALPRSPREHQRFARYLKSFRNELMAITHACGYRHPEEFTADDVEISTGPAQFKTLREMEAYTPKRAKLRA